MTTYRVGRLVTPDDVLEGAWVQVVDQDILAYGRRSEGMPADGQRPVDLGEVTLVPGFVDIHTHGGGGSSYSTTDPEEARKVAAFHAKHGTTTTMASLVTGPLDVLASQTACLADLVKDGVIAGVHLEGPFLSAARCGAHEPTLLRDPVADDVSKVLSDVVRMVTIAPELEHGLQAIRQVVDAGAVAALGHTDATYEQMIAGADAGATVATHLFNGMRPFHHRDPGPVGAAINDERLLLEVINDGMHLDPQVVRVALAAAGVHRIALITDAMEATGMGNGRYKIGDLEVDVKDGLATLAEPPHSIAGSTLTMDVAFRNAVQAGTSLVDAARMASTTPAHAFGWYDVGAIETGRRADLVVLDDDYVVQKVMRAGAWL
ncbi:N-acetylglucosamine-6-phosphate deacetylase [Kribbella sandramycini]|uniref:N-acetylglucosamine-6-phosphate deacetylase n=1 Tax=Kribbella sandramycini TaxID=60450 RepID=A0A7Y4L505_9ACTN|nr:N-acetylglucosamine-6-phosphate deacetylase [Kribbella sandramycini]MBB6571817.1 N-acetylglucosamine-6-phosphate deacetylase [Kribbella sandramycini]NOL44459.1 N-acetylglucosamine-6-phosphate deacetylase [Kribbella sandramycini]